jgi:hypothetical protein
MWLVEQLFGRLSKRVYRSCRALPLALVLDIVLEETFSFRFQPCVTTRTKFMAPS